MSATRTEQATANRELARRARRLATQLSDVDVSVERLLRYAEELEDLAVDLERRAKEDG